MFFIIIALLTPNAWAIDARTQEIGEFLENFERDPKATMQRRRAHYDRRRGPVPPSYSMFPREAVESRQFVAEKIRLRGNTTGSYAGLMATSEYGDDDDPRALIDRFQFGKIQEIEAAQLMSARLHDSPWSDDYWPLYNGSIARRYMYASDVGSQDWKLNFDSFTATENSSSVDALSPAEKYDLLIGDRKKGITAAMWKSGREYYERSGTVETWMGLCHGWAAASYMLPRPARAIEVIAADGQTKIRFFPSDIKALATLLWASGEAPKRMIGGRCNVKIPATNANGRIIDPECFDTNPGTWHLAVVNQIGAAKRAFVMDATFDYQVWNQPVFAYRYTYFNPETNEQGVSAERARVSKARFSKDKFKEFRSRKGAYVLGVAMDIEYTVETRPRHDVVDTAENDGTHLVRYIYDLEVDRAGRIIGGEWYENVHPDFLWTPVPGARARSIGDRYLEARGERDSWDGERPIPESWVAAALKASSAGQPLARIVETLFILSKID